jgi:excisionase family DNA binding protein
MAPSEKYMSIEEVAELLGVTYQLIYRLVRSGDLSAARVGKLYRITPSDLDAYLAKSKAEAIGGMALEICGACGQSYRSRLSFKGECGQCAKPLCLDCWERKGLRMCSEHAGTTKDGEQG